MPELPEVETTLRGLQPHCQSAVISGFEVRQSQLRWPIESEKLQQLVGQPIVDLARRGKYLLINLPEASLIIHLGMSGSLKIVRQEEQAPPQKHDHFDIRLNNGKTIRYNDPRRFGCLLISEKGQCHPRLKTLGVEPLTDQFNPDYLYAACQNRKSSIKSVLMDSHLLVGVGNIYAQEALFLSGISPLKEAGQLSQKKMTQLVEAIKTILNQAIEAGGSSLKDFTAPSGKPGYFQQTLKVYGRQNQPCLSCKSPLKAIKINQRTTTYCPQCQN